MTGRWMTGSERQTVEIDGTEKSGTGGRRLLRRKNQASPEVGSGEPQQAMKQKTKKTEHKYFHKVLKFKVV